MGSNRAYIALRAESSVRHGHRRRGGKSREYLTWLGIKRRCYDVKCKDYPNWGGRGIGVCDRWNSSFEAFLADMGTRPADSEIDRIDTERDYEPGNCRWATHAEQCSEHKRDLIEVTVGGVRFSSIEAAARAHGIKGTTARFRLKAGMSSEEAFTIPTGGMPNRRPRESYLRKELR